MWSRDNKPKSSNRKDKYRCQSCGFTAKGWVETCPNCSSNKIEKFSSKFRFSKKNRKNALKIKRSKSMNARINGDINNITIQHIFVIRSKKPDNENWTPIE